MTACSSFPPGRPRLDELRLVSPKAEALQLWRKKNIDHYREYQRKYQAAWSASNVDRNKEIKRAWYKRHKAKQTETLNLTK